MRVVLVHALVHSMAPYCDAFRRLWPECEALHLLDETLYAELGTAATVPQALAQRMAGLLHHVAGSGANALVFTGSTFGPTIEEVAADLPVPLLRADDAAALQIARAGNRIAVLATAAHAVPVVADRVRRAFTEASQPYELTTHHVEGAQTALFAGRKQKHDALVAEAAARFADRDAILLAQSSMATARDLAGKELRDRILTTPAATVQALRARFAGVN